MVYVSWVRRRRLEAEMKACKLLIEHEKAMKTGYTAPTLPVCGDYGKGTECNSLEPCSHQLVREVGDQEEVKT